jgi:hypothetical protein
MPPEHSHLDLAQRQGLSVRRFACIFIGVAVVLNAILVLVAKHDVYAPHSGVRNLTAIVIALFFSPVLNGLLAVAGSVIVGVYVRRRGRVLPYVVVTVFVAFVAIVFDAVVVFSIVPWHGPGPWAGAH